MVLVEDGSTDNGLEVCQVLTAKYDKVHLYQHLGGVNRGAPASFNLGMKMATNQYIAILGADDYYLHGRFTVAKEIFQDDPECDGVYEAIGVHFEDEQAKQLWFNLPMSNYELTTMTQRFPPEALFERLVKGDVGYFSLNGLVFKKSVLNQVGYMNEDLWLDQDTDFIIRLAAVAKLKSGRLDEPVAMRRVHANNRTTSTKTKAERYQRQMKMRKETHRWFKKFGTDQQRKVILNQMLKECVQTKPLPFGGMKGLPKRFRRTIRLQLFIFEYPYVVLKNEYWKRLFSTFFGMLIFLCLCIFVLF
mgnify:CR=1 FL=1